MSPEENDAIIYTNENCYHMFYNCASLTSLDVSNFNTSNVTNMSYMFQSCSKLTTLDLSSVTESSVMMDIMTGKVNWDGVDIIINIDRTSPIGTLSYKWDIDWIYTGPSGSNHDVLRENCFSNKTNNTISGSEFEQFGYNPNS